MKNLANTHNVCSELIKKMDLPESFTDIVRTVYYPLAEIIIDKKQQSPLLVNINGAQGTGKSTLTRFIKKIIELQSDYRVAELSLDDFYHTRLHRRQLSEQIHPLFITRGVPGTHDDNLIENVLDALKSQRPCKAPRFDKARDERCDETDWVDYEQPVDVILFEGWCIHSPAQTEEQLVNPVNELEAQEDTDGVWRHYANEQLKHYQQRFFRHADLSIMLNAADFERIYEWRRLQEQKLRDTSSASQNQHVMNDVELKRFIQHYERISRHTLKYLPLTADVVLPIASDHSITGIIKNNHDQ